MIAGAELRPAAARGFYELVRSRLVRFVPAASPAAGAEWSLAVPANVLWELVALRATLTTSAAAVQRRAFLVVRDDTGLELQHFYQAESFFSSVTGRLYYLPITKGEQTGDVNDVRTATTPPILLPGWALSSSTINLDAGDQYSGIVAVVREWTPARVLQALEWLETHTR